MMVLPRAREAQMFPFPHGCAPQYQQMQLVGEQGREQLNFKPFPHYRNFGVAFNSD